MLDWAMQALYLMALEPLSEITTDHHSYGFRPMRSTADAIRELRYSYPGVGSMPKEFI